MRPSHIDRLAKLNGLRATGALTDAEFEHEKQKLLSDKRSPLATTYAAVAATGVLAVVAGLLFSSWMGRSVTAPHVAARKAAEAKSQAVEAQPPIERPLPATVAPSQPPPLTWLGRYTGKTEGALGSLTITRRVAGKLHVNLELGGRGCNGGIDFDARPERNLLRHTEPYDPDAQQQCTLMLVNNGDEVVVEEHQCMTWHGFACSFNGTLKRR